VTLTPLHVMLMCSLHRPTTSTTKPRSMRRSVLRNPSHRLKVIVNPYLSKLERPYSNSPLPPLNSHHTLQKQLQQHNTTAMSSDADYEAFLNKANEDSNAGKSSTLSKKTVGTKSVNTAVPKTLSEVDEIYTSESDAPFEPVSLTYKGKNLPSAGKRYVLHDHCTNCGRQNGRYVGCFLS
jgi:hypothetical protein